LEFPEVEDEEDEEQELPMGNVVMEIWLFAHVVICSLPPAILPQICMLVPETMLLRELALQPSPPNVVTST